MKMSSNIGEANGQDDLTNQLINQLQIARNEINNLR